MCKFVAVDIRPVYVYFAKGKEEKWWLLSFCAAYMEFKDYEVLFTQKKKKTMKFEILLDGAYIVV